ncbi:uncharacterized protein DS421_3g101130 [Arachis hypogaea]|nr:uncharacterized protein DS421_3g101130 [Arachis hypogaea]
MPVKKRTSSGTKKEKSAASKASDGRLDESNVNNVKNKVRRPKKPEGPKKKTLDTRCSPTAIADMMEHLKDKYPIKYQEVEKMDFGCLRHIPKWSMSQDLIVALARSYNKNRMHLEVETGDIPVNARVIGQALGLPTNGDSFPKLDPKKHRNLIDTFEGKTQKEVKTHVIRCSVTTEVEKEEFRRYFIMFVMKAFLFASSNKYITNSFIPGVIDVRNPMRFFWGRHIYDCVKEGLRKYKEDGIRTIDGCMFALLILYLHTNKHGDLRGYSGGGEPWTKEWTVAELREAVMEEQVRESGLIRKIDELRKSEREKGNVDEPQKRTRDKRRGAQVRPRTKERTRKRPKKIVAESDEEEFLTETDVSDKELCHEENPGSTSSDKINVPLSRYRVLDLQEVFDARIEKHELQEEVVADCGEPNPVSNEKHQAVIASIENHELQEEVLAECGAPSPMSNEEHHVVNESSVKTSKCLDMVVYSGPHRSVNNMESGEVDHGIPQDDVEECNRLSSKPTSVNNTPPTPAPIIIPPDFDEDAKEKVYRWVIDDRNPLDEVIVWYRTHYTLDLTRRDLNTLKRREWVDGRVIECMCALFNGLPAKRFQEDFYCINPMILGRVMTPMNVEKFEDKHNSEYVGLAECWGNEIRLFNKVEAAKRHTFFVPICLDNHWWLYAFHPKSATFFALDSLVRPPLTDHRVKVDEYAESSIHMGSGPYCLLHRIPTPVVPYLQDNCHTGAQIELNCSYTLGYTLQ